MSLVDGQPNFGLFAAFVSVAYKDMFISPTEAPTQADASLPPRPQGDGASASAPQATGLRLGAERMLAMLKAAGEPTRLRALALLARGELAVGELAQALGQSQPRISRHLRLLVESGLVDRLPEGAWVFYRLADRPAERGFANAVLNRLDSADPAFTRDAARLAEIRAAREAAASAYFAANADDWARVRALHLPEADIEAALLAVAGFGPFGLMVDVGSGAGRMLQVFADRAQRVEGFDSSRQMLAIARTAIAHLPEGRAHVRFGDVYDPPLAAGMADLVTIHHVLHFLADPARAIAESAALLKPGGRLVISDFAPHSLEFLRTEHQHRRLGFTDAEIAAWCAQADVALDRVEALAPAASDAARLTVKVWAGARSAKAAPTQAEGVASS
jgi:DNA-binding transcriptional ArsR family regulator/SAM-dependent methyltransferase